MPRLFSIERSPWLALILFLVPGCLAQRVSVTALRLAMPEARITAIPASDHRSILKGNTPPMAQARYDQGPADSTLAGGHITLLLQRSASQEQALQSYLRALQDPQSPSYRQWLTPQMFGQNFGVADQDLETIKQWLVGQGFKIESVPAGRTRIVFSGTVGQVNSAFHTSIHRYLVNGQMYYSNNADPEIPGALAPVVAGVGHLNNFFLKPSRPFLGNTTMAKVDDKAEGKWPRIKPAYTGTIGGAPALFVTPSDAATIYNAPTALNRNYTSSTPLRDGHAVNIGLAGESDLVLRDYLDYRKLFLGETSPVSPTIVIDGADPGLVVGYPAVQALLDAENAAALAPGANIYFYSSRDDLLESGVENAAIRAIEDNVVSILSVGLYNCEASLGVSGNAGFASLWEQAAAQGITVLVAAGNSGSAGCDISDINGSTSATGGLAVNGIASTPYNVAVGGTDFDVLANAFGNYVTNDENSGYGSALSYIPENPWNDSISNNPPGAYAANTVATSDGVTTIAAGAGGPSTNALCTAAATSADACPAGTAEGYPIPAFQVSSAFAGTPLSGSTVRELPDISLFAASGVEHHAAWALCSDSGVNNDSSGTYKDCQPDSSGAFTLTQGGGSTAASTSAWAGILALVSEALGGERLGQANQVLYNLAATNYGGIFHDITVGNNSVPCASSSRDCGSNGFLNGYNAGTGYDLATGLGTVDITALVTAWGQVSFVPTSVVLLANPGTGVSNPSTAPLAITHGSPVTFSTSVSPASATGLVAIEGPTGQAGGAIHETISLSEGSGSVTTSSLPGGSYTVHAYYPGDATHAPSTSAEGIAIAVSPEPSTLRIHITEQDPSAALSTALSTINPATAPYGELGFVYAQPVNATAGIVDGIATGTVTLQNHGSTFSTPAFTNPEVLDSQGFVAYPLRVLPPGSYSFSAVYPGDASFNASASATLPLTIEQAPTSLTLANASSSTLAFLLSTDSVGDFPTGSFALAANGQSYAPQQVSQTYLTGGIVTETVTFALPASTPALAAFTASYSGDTNYQPASLQMQQGFTLTGPSGAITLAPGATGTAAITVASTLGFSGTVQLSCAFAASSSGGTAPTCSLQPSSVVLQANSATSTLTVTTTAQTSSTLVPLGPMPRLRQLLSAGGSAMAVLFLVGMPGRRKAWRAMLIVLVAVGLLGTSGCGVTVGKGEPHPVGTPGGTYTLTITGTSGSTTASTNVQVVVT